METSPMLFFVCLSLLVVVQMTTWPFFLNLFLSSFITVMLLYFAMLTTTLLPIESFLLQLYDKKGERELEKPPLSWTNQSGHLSIKRKVEAAALELTRLLMSQAETAEIGRSQVDELANAAEADAMNTFDDEITRKLRELIGHIVRDFILDWYNTVSDDVEFVQQAFEIFEHIFTDFRTRVSQVDAEKLARILLNHLSRHYRCHKRAMFYAKSQSGKDGDRAQQLMVVTYEKLNGHLALSNLPDTEADHLRSLVAILLKALLPRDYSLSGTSTYLVRELISRNVLFPFVDMLSRPTWIYGAVVKVLDKEAAEESDTDSSTSLREILNEEEIDTETVEAEIGGERSDALLNNYRTAVYEPEENAADKRMSARYSSSQGSETIQLDIPARVSGDYTDSAESLSPTPLPSDMEFSFNSNSGSAGPSTSSVTSLPLLAEAQLSHFAEPRVEVTLTSTEGSLTKRKHMEQKHGVVRGGFISPRIGEKPADSRNSIQEQRIFQHVRIPETIIFKEALDIGSKYTMYKVVYTAPVPQAPTKKLFKSPFTKVVENPQADPNSKTLKSFQVCRRFREFLTLQDRLNENNLIRKLIQGVRAPSRMFPMPIGNMDKEYIEKRRLFLQAYLRELCSYSLVCQSTEMKEFLAYGSDPRLAYVRRPSDFIPRFDKMIKNAVQDLLGSASLKIADTFAPDDDSEFYVPTPPRGVAIRSAQSFPQLAPDPDPCVDDSSGRLTRAVTQQNLAQSQQKFGAVTKFKNMVLGRPNTPDVLKESYREFAPFAVPRNSSRTARGRGWRTPENLLENRNRFGLDFTDSSRRTQGDGCDVMDSERDGDAKYLGEYLISGQIFRLTRAIWNIGLGVNSLSFLAAGRFVTEFINREVKSLTVKDKWLQYLSMLQDTLWPKGEWKNDDFENQKTEEQVFNDAARALEAALPDVLPLIVGHSRYSEGVRELLESFQNQTINRHLAYHLLDTTVRVLFPDLQTVLAGRRNVVL